jgi:glycosyltransferase involved in cell wall biosynthesis
MQFKFHCVGLAHTSTTKAYSNCAFTENVRKFCIMLKQLGHHVTLYASEDNEAPCDEFVTCITKLEQKRTCGVTGPETVLNAKYDGNLSHWQLFNQRVIEEMRKRVQQKDFLALIVGDLADPIIKAFPQALPIEYAVGYTGISQHTKRAFASSAWMHTVYGRYYGARGTPGRFYDRVIPHYLDPDDFTYSAEKDDYFLFVGRLNEDKGVRIAADVCRILGKKLVVAGQGPIVPEGCDYRGLIGVTERARLMSRAKALFVPSMYLEPFGMVAIESLMSGTPLITTDWGGLREINLDGVTGYRCNMLQDFVTAAKRIDEISPVTCRKFGELYSIEHVKHAYEKWFKDLYELWGEGWNKLDRSFEAGPAVFHEELGVSGLPL